MKTPISETYNMDCLEYMAGLPDKYFGLAIVDPEYGIGESRRTQSRPLTAKQANGTRIAVKGARKHAVKDWDDKRPDAAYFKELQRVSKNQIIWGGNYFADLLPPSSGWVVWDKVNDKSDQSDFEMAWTSFKCGARLFRYMWNGFNQGYSSVEWWRSQGNKALNESRIHPTQKPVALYRWLLENYAKPGDTIFDSHLGSGSSRIAAYDLGFDFTGTELDKDYFEAATARFERHKSQLKLFTPQQAKPEPIQLSL